MTTAQREGPSEPEGEIPVEYEVKFIDRDIRWISAWDLKRKTASTPANGHLVNPTAMLAMLPGKEENLDRDFTDSLLCRTTEGSRLYKLKCVLGSMKSNWNKIHGACEVDNKVRLDQEKHVHVKLLQRVTKAYGGVEKKIKAEVIKRDI